MLDKKRDRARAKQRGAGRRFIFQIIWFGVAITIAFFLSRFLFLNGILSYQQIYQGGVPSTWPPLFIDIIATIMIYLVIQALFMVGYMLGNPAGRRPTSRASLDTFNPDYNDFRDGN